MRFILPSAEISAGGVVTPSMASPLLLATCLAANLFAGCGDSDSAGPNPTDAASDVSSSDAGDIATDTGSDDAIVEQPRELNCPGQQEFPFDLEVEAGAWASERNGQAVAEALYDNTAHRDFYGNPADPQTLVGVLGVAASALQTNVLPGEPVSLWRFNDVTTSWEQLGRTTTAADGSYSFDLGTTFDAGSHKVWAVFEAGRTCYTHSLMVWPEGTQLVLSDIDGTLTLSDDELFAEIGDPTYDQQTKGSAIELIQAWDAKGYDLVYLTARPGDFRPMTEAWKARRGLPHGLTQFAFSLGFGETARAYKAEFISELLNDMQWDIVAAYGNATSDIEACADAGIPLDVTFIIGEHAGESGTVAIPNDDYAAHIAEWVSAQPDATVPAP
ncbi:MAG: hypothetical protein KGO50_06695 [Myxococcales bacterium]|nr:hypothetical protein [Myxococcales bacterium]